MPPTCRQAEALLLFTAGGFIYVAAVDILPAVLAAKATPAETLLQAGALAAGIWMMVLVAALE